MKRSFKYLGLLLAFILVMTGCSLKKVDPKKQLEDALEKTSKATSFNEKVVATATMKEDGKEQTVNVEGDFDIYQESEDAASTHGTLKLSSESMSYSAEAYLNIDKKNVGAYVNFLGNWIKFEQEINEEEYKKVLEEYKKKFGESKPTDLMKYVKEVKSEKTDKKDYTKLTVVIDKDKVNESVKKTFNEVKDDAKKEITDSAATAAVNKEEVDEAISQISNITDKGILSENISFTVYIKDGYVSSVEVDVAKIVKNAATAMGVSEEDLKDFNDMTLKETVELSNFNKVEKIIVPEEAKKGTNVMDMIKKLYEEYINKQDPTELFGSSLGM